MASAAAQAGAAVLIAETLPALQLVPLLGSLVELMGSSQGLRRGCIVIAGQALELQPGLQDIAIGRSSCSSSSGGGGCALVARLGHRLLLLDDVHRVLVIVEEYVLRLVVYVGVVYEAGRLT